MCLNYVTKGRPNFTQQVMSKIWLLIIPDEWNVEGSWGFCSSGLVPVYTDVYRALYKRVFMLISHWMFQWILLLAYTCIHSRCPITTLVITHYIPLSFSKCYNAQAGRNNQDDMSHNCSFKGNSWRWQWPTSWLQLAIGGRFWVRVTTLLSSKWDVCSREMNYMYISPVSPKCITESLCLIWQWSKFITHGSSFSPVRYPYQIWRKCLQQILSPVTSIKSYLLFLPQLLLPFNQKLPIRNRRFPSLSVAGHICPKVHIHQELYRRILIG